MTTTTSTEAEPTQAEPPPPAPLSFDDIPLTAPIRAAIDAIGWTEPTPVQVETFVPSVEGKDLIVQSRTGTGKTAAFGLPLVDRLVTEDKCVQALILAPTRELALQSAREISRLAGDRDISTTAVYGGAGMDRQVRELADGAQIVSGTPGRVLDHLKRGTLDPSNLRVLVLDEADEMLSMGFAKEMNAIIERLTSREQTLLFSATVDGPVQRVAQRHMTDPVFVTLSGDAVGALGVSHFVYMVTGVGRTRDLVKILEIEDPESAIIFCNTKAETEQVSAELVKNGFNAAWINGDLPQNEREKVMARTREGIVRFLVATDVAARGIDVSHLTHVINYGLPNATEQYVHRTGRTGRAGRTGTAISLVPPQELGTLYYLRLTYKIFPVERSLPTEGEERTRVEVDRINMLEAAANGVAELDIAVARRLLTHPRAEKLLANLLNQFFGTKIDVDEQAAAARRSRTATPAEPEAVAVANEDRPKKRRSRRRKTRSDAPTEEATVAPSEDAPVRTRTGDNSSGSPAPEPAAETTSVDGEAPVIAAEGPEARDEPEMATLFVSVGRRDEVRAGDINRLFRDQTDLGRDEIGRIRVRDRHTFVEVPPEKVEEVVEALHGRDFQERELIVELARRQ